MIWIGIFIVTVGITVWMVVREISPPPPAPSSGATDEQPQPAPEEASPPESPREAPVPDAGEPTLTAAPLLVPWPPVFPPALPAPAAIEEPVPAAPAAPPAPPTTSEGAAEAAGGRLVVLEDLRLDDVLQAAEELAGRPRHPALRLAVGITACGLLFAGGILLLARGISALWDTLVK